MHLKMSSAKWQPFCLGLNVLMFVTCYFISLCDCQALTKMWCYKTHEAERVCASTKHVNSLAPGRFEWNFKWTILKLILVTTHSAWDISYEITLSWISLDFTDGKSTLVQVMAWCHQATSHYLNQCWPRSMSPYGVTRPQWVNNWKLIYIESLTLTCTRLLRASSSFSLILFRRYSSYANGSAMVFACIEKHTFINNSIWHHRSQDYKHIAPCR